MEPDEPGPSQATLRSTTKATAHTAYSACTYTTERAIDESTQPCVHMCVSRGGRGSLTSLGLRMLLLYQLQTQPNSRHSGFNRCVFHAVVDRTWAFVGYYESPPKLQILCGAFSCAHCIYLVVRKFFQVKYFPNYSM